MYCSIKATSFRLTTNTAAHPFQRPALFQRYILQQIPVLHIRPLQFHQVQVMRHILELLPRNLPQYLASIQGDCINHTRPTLITGSIRLTRLLVVVASPSPSAPPSSVPITSSPTAKPIGTQIALYDEGFGAPYCREIGNVCNSLGLLTGVGQSEVNSPNTIDECSDYSIGVHRQDESIEQMVVRSVSGKELAVGLEVEVIAIVYTASNTSGRDEPNEKDMGFFFYTSNVHDINWKFVEAFALDTGTGVKEVRTRLVLQPGSAVQVRLSFIAMSRKWQHYFLLTLPSHRFNCKGNTFDVWICRVCNTSMLSTKVLARYRRFSICC